jgi:hypothetical protein
MEAIGQFLDAPVKVWHLILVAIFVGARAVQLQKQLNAIGKCTFEVWERTFHPEDD